MGKVEKLESGAIDVGGTHRPVHLSVSGDVSVQALERLCKTMRESCGDAAIAYAHTDADGNETIRLFGYEPKATEVKHGA
jgi:hypothetical protein